MTTAVTEDLDQYAAAYAELEAEWGPVYHANVRERVTLFRPYFIEGDALELGTGGGHTTMLLADQFRRVCSVEGSPQLAARLRDRGLPPNVDLVVDRFETFGGDPYLPPAKVYQNIFLIQVLEHVDDPVAILKRYRNLLSRWKGRMFVTVPNATSLHRLAAVEMGLLGRPDDLNAVDRRAGHKRVYDVGQLTRHVHAAGLRATLSTGFFLKPLSNGQIASQWTGEMIDAFHAIAKHVPNHCAEIAMVLEPWS